LLALSIRNNRFGVSVNSYIWAQFMPITSLHNYLSLRMDVKYNSNYVNIKLLKI